MVLIHLQTAYNDLRLTDMLHVDGYEHRAEGIIPASIYIKVSKHA